MQYVRTHLEMEVQCGRRTRVQRHYIRGKTAMSTPHLEVVHRDRCVRRQLLKYSLEIGAGRCLSLQQLDVRGGEDDGGDHGPARSE